MIKDVFVIEGCPENWEKAIELTSSKLYNEGCVKNSFFNACIEREKVYPTGLDTEMPVAIPHTDAIHVISPAICVLVLKKPVIFSRMDDERESVEAQFVFNMALNKCDDQIVMLQQIIGVVQDCQFLKNAKNSSLNALQKILYDKWVCKY